MGVLAGLLLGLGLLLAWSASWPTTASRTPAFVASWRDLTARAGLHWIGPVPLAVASLACAAVAGILAIGTGTALSVAVAFALIAGSIPLWWLRSRALRRRTDLRTLWPDVVDDLTSAVRAGLSLPEALVAQAERGRPELREEMAAFAAEYRATGHFTEALDVWQERLADPVADRIAACLRLASQVGGNDLGRILRSLSEFLREDQRTRGELTARQSWTTNGARLAVAAPWVVLALMSGRGSTAAAFDTPAGIAVLAVGAAISALAYSLMKRIGRLPEEPRILRRPR